MKIIMQNKEPNKPKIVKADTSLQQKIGTGKIDGRVIEECQTVIDNNDVDFAPLAQEYLDKLTVAIDKAKASDSGKAEAVHDLTAPVMQLKANATTFKYNLIGNLANVMLSFLEGIKELDRDAIAIIEAHQKTLTVIINKKMDGYGGAVGAQMEEELKKACDRYFAKKS